MNSAKKVALLLLHHLPPKCLFNILNFGSSQFCIAIQYYTYMELYALPSSASDTLFPTSVMKNKDTTNTASKFIQVCTPCLQINSSF